MSKVGKIKIRKFEDLAEKGEDAKPTVNPKTPPPRETEATASAATTSKKRKVQETDPVTTTTTKKAGGGGAKKKTPPQNQKLIVNFFKSSSKTYRIEPDVNQKSSASPAGKENQKQNVMKRRVAVRKTAAKNRKQLFNETTSTTSESTVWSQDKAPRRSARTKAKCKKRPVRANASAKKCVADPEDCIDLCSDSDSEDAGALKTATSAVTSKSTKKLPKAGNEKAQVTKLKKVVVKLPILPLPFSVKPRNSKDSSASTSIRTNVSSTKKVPATRARKARPCPSYKIIAGSTFAVDAFQFGQIPGVTHYFLTHFHADHYVGLTRQFSMPLFLSPITARLVRAFIPLADEYLHEIELDQPITIEGVEVTAIDANHCPGAVMFVFKFSTGKCILHTGDFRASPDMESEPIFWNNDIDTIYLDTTYISNKYAFRTQTESIEKAKYLVNDFRLRHRGKRILYVCGSYIIGKERFWASMARTFELKVWTESNRRKALNAMQIKELMGLLCDDPKKANMHVITMVKLSYLSLVEYFQLYKDQFDLLLAIRPSGWEKNSKPQFRGAINIIGVEYSEHSSHDELQRFVMYLKPRAVISTVPVGGGYGQSVTSTVPTKWYQYDKLRGKRSNYQPSLTSYFKTNTKNVADTSMTTEISSNEEIFNKTPQKCLMPKKVEDKVNSPYLLRSTQDLTVHDSTESFVIEEGIPASSFGGSSNKHSPLKNTADAVAGSPPPNFDADAMEDWCS